MSFTTEIILRFNRPRSKDPGAGPRRWGSKTDWVLILASAAFCIAGGFALLKG
jgi:hypothetical protein